MAAETIPVLFHGLIDDAAVFPPGNAPLEAALHGHVSYRRSWFAPLVGPLLLPATAIPSVTVTTTLRAGLIADTGVAAIAPLLERLPPHIEITHIEAPTPDAETLDALSSVCTATGLPGFAEIAWDADELIERCLTRLTPKFRTGGLRADLFPSPAQLARAVTTCARNGCDFKLTAGLHRAIRHRDAATGFWHHGFVNVLAAAAEAADGGGVGAVTQCLETTESQPLAERLTGMLDHPRPLWTGFGSCSVTEPLDDLIGLSLLPESQKES